MELDQFGLKVFNANIKELEDAHGSEYFSYMRQKTRSSAENEAKINIAEANNRGTVIVNDKENTTKIQLAQIKAKTIMAENAQKQSVLSSNAELVLATANQESQTQIQQAEIQRRTEQSIFENNTSLALAKTERDSRPRYS
jgi:flotillin